MYMSCLSRLVLRHGFDNSQGWEFVKIDSHILFIKKCSFTWKCPCPIPLNGIPRPFFHTTSFPISLNGTPPILPYKFSLLGQGGRQWYDDSPSSMDWNCPKERKRNVCSREKCKNVAALVSDFWLVWLAASPWVVVWCEIPTLWGCRLTMYFSLHLPLQTRRE